jgi:RNA polymerase sigma-70 factor (ECF subfamily)
MRTCIQKTQHLVALAKEGDKSALNQLYSIYTERVHWMVRFRMGKELRSKLESMDMVQDTLIHALNDLDDFTYKNEGDFIRWLSTIAENVIRGNLKKLHTNKRDIRREVPLNSYGPNVSSRLVENPSPIAATTPSVIMSKKEDLCNLEKAIDQLKPKYREVIVLAKIDGLSYKDIGKRLGKSEDAVGMLLSRAMLALTNVFESN